MKDIGKFIGGLFLFLLAWALFLPISFLNFFIVGLKFKDLGYFKSSAVNLDRFGNSEFRTLFNLTLKKKEGYNTLSFAGKVLVFILDTIDKNHCKKSIKEF